MLKKHSNILMCTWNLSPKLCRYLGYFPETGPHVSEQTLVHPGGRGAPGLEEAQRVREALAADQGHGGGVWGNQHGGDSDEVLRGH